MEKIQPRCYLTISGMSIYTKHTEIDKTSYDWDRMAKISESLVNAVMREQAKGCWAWPKMGMRFGWGLKQPPHGL